MMRSTQTLRRLLAVTVLVLAGWHVDSFANDFMGLSFGMSREAVEQVAGRMKALEGSSYHNAFSAQRFPNEDSGDPYLDGNARERLVYFDSTNRLWRGGMAYAALNDDATGAMSIYRGLRKILDARGFQLLEVNEQPLRASFNRNDCAPEVVAGIRTYPIPLANVILQRYLSGPTDIPHAGQLSIQMLCGMVKPWSAIYRAGPAKVLTVHLIPHVIATLQVHLFAVKVPEGQSVKDVEDAYRKRGGF